MALFPLWAESKAAGEFYIDAVKAYIFAPLEPIVFFYPLPEKTEGEKEPPTIEETIQFYADEYGIDFELVKAIAKAESWSTKLNDYDPKAKNSISSAKGIYQFLDSTWKKNCDGDVLDYDDNIRCGVRLISEGKENHWLPSVQFWWPQYKKLMLARSAKLLRNWKW